MQVIQPTFIPSLRGEEMDGDYENSDFDENIEITELDDSRYSTSFHVSKKYFGLIIGTRQQTKDRIEQDTKTELMIPGHGQDGNITVVGPTASNVKAARRQINMIVVSSRMKQRPTHFISIPMNTPDIMDNFTRFQEAVLRDCQNRGLHESIFIKPSKIHLTVGVTCLTDNQERILASNLLTEAKEKVIMPLLQDHLPLKIRIRGLSNMGNDSGNMKVLYAKVEEHESTPGILQQLADNIVDFYSRKGLMNKNEFGRDSVKLHVTLVNIKYRSKSSQDSQDIRVKKNKRITFDGADILDKFGNFDFGVLEVTEIHLSQISTIGPDGFYEPTFKISIP
ncbi:activating signal cointegrator 1 complex subunit 1-like [Cydia amplana]|uniref:activating signal cointegrator 1 complex subunit 1-like n=1 Tax=Cydia amplana TaxID=1869771 RepID=UPI002FE55397